MIGGATGTVIDLVYWGDADPPEAWYVRGHLDEPTAVEAVRVHLEAEVEEESRENVPALGACRHLYGRWGLGRDEWGGLVSRVWYTSPRASRGAFPVTEVRDVDALELRRAERAAQLAHAAELTRWVRERYPAASSVEANGYPVGQGRVRFRLPELAGVVEYHADKPGEVRIERRDRGAWARLYGAAHGSP